MLGLRTQETDKFEKFFEIVQKKAEKMNSVFFLETGDGNDFETETMEGENLQGWLVPIEKVNEFKEIWEQHKEDDRYVDFFCWVEWFSDKNNIDIKFITD